MHDAWFEASCDVRERLEKLFPGEWDNRPSVWMQFFFPRDAGCQRSTGDYLCQVIYVTFTRRRGRNRADEAYRWWILVKRDPHKVNSHLQLRQSLGFVHMQLWCVCVCVCFWSASRVFLLLFSSHIHHFDIGYFPPQRNSAVSFSWEECVCDGSLPHEDVCLCSFEMNCQEILCESRSYMFWK